MTTTAKLSHRKLNEPELQNSCLEYSSVVCNYMARLCLNGLKSLSRSSGHCILRPQQLCTSYKDNWKRKTTTLTLPLKLTTVYHSTMVQDTCIARRPSSSPCSQDPQQISLNLKERTTLLVSCRRLTQLLEELQKWSETIKLKL